MHNNNDKEKRAQTEKEKRSKEKDKKAMDEQTEKAYLNIKEEDGNDKKEGLKRGWPTNA
jgi:hypothetical protein